jgi:hypothetical protein
LLPSPRKPARDQEWRRNVRPIHLEAVLACEGIGQAKIVHDRPEKEQLGIMFLPARATYELAE